MIARPCCKVGLTGEKAAHLMLDNGWETFWVPSVVASDQGPQFASQWWKTMCGRLGIRMAFSQAYYPQANGRAEVAGKQLIIALSRVMSETRGNWVELLPRVVRAYHDIPGESGLSPFHILFGRDRYEAGVPYEVLQECEDATNFFNRMEESDRKVAEVLNELHKSRRDTINVNRARKVPYKVGEWVWIVSLRVV